jgi:hypothetical protein
MECVHEGCTEPAGSKQAQYQCQLHYALELQQMIKEGRTRNGKAQCKVLRCYNKAQITGLCRKHWDKQKATQ